jgi:hypothetical protein
MIGPTIVFLFAAGLVAAYILIVNRMLRTDENWSESNQLAPQPARARVSAPTGKLAHA